MTIADIIRISRSNQYDVLRELLEKRRSIALEILEKEMSTKAFTKAQEQIASLSQEIIKEFALLT